MSSTATATATRGPGRPRREPIVDQTETIDLPGNVDDDLAILEQSYRAALARTGAAEAAANAPPKVPTLNSPAIFYRQQGSSVIRIDASILRLYPPDEPGGPALADLLTYIGDTPQIVPKSKHEPGFPECWGLLGEPPRRPPTRAEIIEQERIRALEIVEQERQRGSQDAPRLHMNVAYLKKNRLGLHIQAIPARITGFSSMDTVDLIVTGDGGALVGPEIKNVKRGHVDGGWTLVKNVPPGGFPVSPQVGTRCGYCGCPIQGMGLPIRVGDEIASIHPLLLMTSSVTATICHACRPKIMSLLNAIPEPIEATASTPIEAAAVA